MQSGQELLAAAGITYVHTTSGKYTTTCPECNGGYLNVKVDKKGATWFCAGCGFKGPQRMEKKDKSGDFPPIQEIYDYTDEDGARIYQALRFDTTDPEMRFRQRRDPDQK